MSDLNTWRRNALTWTAWARHYNRAAQGLAQRERIRRRLALQDAAVIAQDATLQRRLPWD